MRTTDMADELFRGPETELPAGVRLATAKRGGVTVTRVEIAREGLARPRGRYVTLEMPSVSVLDERDTDVIETGAAELRALLPPEGPVLVLSIGKISIYARYVRAATIQQLSEDYVLFAISKGASRVYILLRHVLKNCLLPVITLVGMNLGSLVSGAYIVETIFGWPGLGTTGMSAIYSRDYNMIMGTTMLSCLLLVGGNLLADLCYCLADPRIKAMRGDKR